jgi:mannose-6-phosphate isomerase-like protein (cupin superfamily)
LAGRAKTAVSLASSDVVRAVVQVVGSGGETNLHAHTGQDGFWFVLSGAARFHTPEGITHEVGPHEGVLIPHGETYGFESSGDEPLEILHIAAFDRRLADRRVNATPVTAATEASYREFGMDPARE